MFRNNFKPEALGVAIVNQFSTPKVLGVETANYCSTPKAWSAR